MYGPPKGASYSVALPLDERAAHRRLLEKNVSIVVDLHNGRGAGAHVDLRFHRRNTSTSTPVTELKFHQLFAQPSRSLPFIFPALR